MEIQSIGILPPPMLGSPKEMNDTEENGNISQGEEGEQKDGEKTLEPNPELNEEEGSKSGEEKTQEETDDLEKKLSEDSGNSPSEGSLLGSEENVNEKSRRQMVSFSDFVSLIFLFLLYLPFFFLWLDSYYFF